MNEILSEAEREKRAREVYKSAYWSAFFIGLAILIALEVCYFLVLQWLKIKAPSNSGWAGGFPVFMVFGAHIWGFKALRRAGLLHEEREVLLRMGDVAAGEAVAFYYPKSLWGKLGLIAVLVAMGVGSWWLWQYQNEKFLGAFGILMSFGVTVLSVRSFNLPNVFMNDTGIFGYVYGSGLWPRLVRWNEIGSVQIDLISGLPAPPFKKDAVAATIVLKGEAGKTLMRLNSNTFMGAPPEFQQRFIAELKRRLTAATAPKSEENCDE